MTATPPTLRWVDPSWQAQARGWIRNQVAAAGRRLVAEIDQPHVRPWSTVLRVPTDAGLPWFKATGAGTVYEPRLLAGLHRWGMPGVLAPLAVDAERGWMLLPDGGPTLRSLLADAPDLGHWERLLPAYAELQRRLEPRVDALLELGVPDLRPVRLPALLAGLLADDAAMLRGDADGLSAPAEERLRRRQPEFARCCTELTRLGVAPTLQHDDFHDANVFVRAGEYVFFDWGDAGVAHPFSTLLVVVRGVADRFGVRPEGPEVRRLRDAYLEPWTAAFDRGTLLTACRLAVRVAPVGRALAWQRALAGLPAAALDGYAAAVPGWLAELLEPDQLPT